MPMRVLIVDDEPPARERLRRLLSGIEGVELIGEAEGGVQAVEMIEGEKPDLVLLDIQMPGLDGFGVIEALEDPPPVIFVTAYDEYAIRAFEVNALDYLLKPFSRERLEKAIRRAQEALTEEQGLGVSPVERFATRLGPLLESLAAQGCYLTRLAVRDYESRRIRVLDVSEIDWIEVEEEQVMAHAGDRVYPIRRTLAWQYGAAIITQKRRGKQQLCGQRSDLGGERSSGEMFTSAVSCAAPAPVPGSTLPPRRWSAAVCGSL